MNCEGQPCEPQPDLAAEVDDESLKEELVCASVEEVEQPLLGRVGSVMPDVASAETLLGVEVVLSVPGLVHHLGDSETLSVCESHVLGVAQFVVRQSTS